MNKLLITGASGFLGSILVSHLLRSQYEITTIGISDSDNIYCNLALSIPTITKEFDWIIHIAGKAHTVPRNSIEIKEFTQVNVEGTKNLIKGIEQSSRLPQSILFISSVAVYGLESGTNINEEHPLLGTSAYAQSKIQAEYYLKSWCSKNNVKLGILRPSLIAGINPPGNLGSMINGIKSGNYFRIKGISARRSLLMAEDIARIIPKVAEVGGVFNVCDNHHPSFTELEELIAMQLDKSIPRSIPYWLAKSMALTGDLIGNRFPINSNRLNKLCQTLTFSNEKAKTVLSWEPLDVLQNFKIN